jgi:hypothetical protein
MEELGLKSGSPNAQPMLVLAKLDQVQSHDCNIDHILAIGDSD